MARTIVNVRTGKLTIDESFDVGEVSDPAPTLVVYEDAIQAFVDDTARSRQFRDGVTLASYANSTNAQWAEEANVFIAWRDAVWAWAYAEFDRVTKGQRLQPSVRDILAELPRIVWP